MWHSSVQTNKLIELKNGIHTSIYCWGGQHSHEWDSRVKAPSNNNFQNERMSEAPSSNSQNVSPMMLLIKASLQLAALIHQELELVNHNAITHCGSDVVLVA
jgi:hypothetical protein